MMRIVLVFMLAASSATLARASVEEFSNDVDSYHPTTRDPESEPALSGSPPLDWAERRNTFQGVVEEIQNPLANPIFCVAWLWLG